MSQPLSSSWFILCPSPCSTPFLTWAPCLSLCVTSLHTFISPLLSLPLFHSLSLPVTFTLSQNYDDIDLENEPWYKFFSELEFGRPVSQGRSCFFNHNPVLGSHPLSPPRPLTFSFVMYFYSSVFVPTSELGGASCLGMWSLLGAVNPLYLHPSPPALTPGRVSSVLPSPLVWWLAGTVMFSHRLVLLNGEFAQRRCFTCCIRSPPCNRRSWWHFWFLQWEDKKRQQTWNMTKACFEPYCLSQATWRQVQCHHWWYPTAIRFQHVSLVKHLNWLQNAARTCMS